MMKDVIDSFKNTTPDVSQKFVQKVKVKQVTITGSHARKASRSIMFFQVTPFYCPIFKKYAELKTQK